MCDGVRVAAWAEVLSATAENSFWTTVGVVELLRGFRAEGGSRVRRDAYDLFCLGLFQDVSL